MFKAIKTAHKLGSIGAKWAVATSVDPGDNGQVARLASQYIDNVGLEPEDAWLMAMVNWMSEMPWPDSKMMVARAMIQFLNSYEGKIALSAKSIIGARVTAQAIIESAPTGIKVVVNSKRKITGIAASTVDHILQELGVSALLSGALVLSDEFGVSFRSSLPMVRGSNRAAVAIGNLKQAEMFKALHSAGINDPMLFEGFVDDLVFGAMREFEAQSPEFASLST